ncbi:MAG: hypothetical protein QOJ26_860 [Thermoplasmata archaeon]|jgi:hypothetical protein|nr:hypothetical protein [Thermoplasmata archaeon]MEA3165991.1 hypothetical protein [Thermoplasmata archaeon]
MSDGHPVTPVVLAQWKDLQDGIRHLGIQRGLRFVAACILAPFGASDLQDKGDGSGAHVTGFAFGIALFLLAIAELAAIGESSLLAKMRMKMEKHHPALAPHDEPSRWARVLSIVSGPGFSTALYAILGAAVVVGYALK